MKSPEHRVSRRAAILDRLADHVLAEGLAASSLRSLADAADTSDRMLLYYFKDKAEVMSATIECIAGRLTKILEEQNGSESLAFEPLRAKIWEIVSADELWPFMRLWLEIASRSAREDPFYRIVGEQIARGFLAWGTAQLKSATPAQREVDAAKLLVSIEGMVMLKSLGLEDACRTALESEL
ncbi:MAG: TetR/AcrR family transcriptional regulator [bacterium]|nr:TetR/AcrR family transcriptional regulator [bacterium]